MTIIAAAIPFTQGEHGMYERLKASPLTVLIVLAITAAILFYFFKPRK